MTEPTEKGSKKELSGRCWDCGYEGEPDIFADISHGGRMVARIGLVRFPRPLSPKDAQSVEAGELVSL